MSEFLRRLPKAELHMHIEGSLEPELLVSLARRNAVELGYPSVEAIRAAYDFSNLQSFLDIYYQGAAVLQTEADFYDVTRAYLARAAADGVRHVEPFFDPQTHTERGVPMETVVDGIHRALEQGWQEHGISSGLIMCFLRHLSAEEAMETLERALPHRDKITAVGLDSTELGNPPEKFRQVFARAGSEGFRLVAHAGEEGPPEFVWQALDVLEVARIDHGVRALEDPALIERLRVERTPLTVCPLSNVKLRVFPSIEEHNIRELHEAGLCVTVNSDDPAYFGGYIGANFQAVKDGLGLDDRVLVEFARNSFNAAFVGDARRAELLAELDGYLAEWGMPSK